MKLLWKIGKRGVPAENLAEDIKDEISIIAEVNGDKDFDERININIITRISLTKKRFYIPIKLKNNSKILTINSLVDMRGEGFFFY